MVRSFEAKKKAYLRTLKVKFDFSVSSLHSDET